MNPPILVFKSQVILSATEKQHMLRFELKSIGLWIEKTISMNEAIFNQNL